jgi:inosine triphosphate pyrophosphatase
MAPQELNFITGNKNKLSEVQAILEGVIDLKNQNLDLPEIQGTVEEVSKDKCRRAAEIVRNIEISIFIPHLMCIRLEDQFSRKTHVYASMLWENYRGHICVTPLSRISLSANLKCFRKWFLKQLGPFELHKMLAGFDDKSAVAIATFAYCEGPGHEPITFQGRTEVKFSTALPGLAHFETD